MAEYIEREALYKEVTEKYHDILLGMYPFNYIAYDMARLIKTAPTADVVEVKHGEWIKDNNFSQIVNKYKCSLCGVEDIVLHHNFCPNCGAKMDLKG